MKKFLLWALVPLFMACQSNVQDDSQRLSATLSGDMLFEGANTLQGSSETTIESIAQAIGCKVEAIQSIGVKTVEVEMNAEDHTITESLLFQVVSNNQELSSIATLSPLPDSNLLKMQVAEEIDLAPYLKDEGLTWVMDLNLTEDHMDPMTAQANLTLLVNYKDEK